MLFVVSTNLTLLSTMQWMLIVKFGIPSCWCKSSQLLYVSLLKGLAWFSQFITTNNESQAKSLRSFCPTRWTMWLVSLQAIATNYNSIIEWLDEVDSIERNATGVKASGYSKSLKNYNSLCLLEILRMVFTIVVGGSSSLQGTQLSFCKAEKVIQCIRQSVKNARTDDRFSNLW